ncbi:MAG: N-acetyltransferase [Mitsuaria chitosanitabida]|uniref:GNAT family N-acetyltransferase n=1 Tax=Roseateles chitosanitabidus TaxID=65048 RepID=UPI001AFF9B01|nr:GNAT family N-acetyltransferase [Roseateles chitosanitabidus]MBO9688091.1 N-acetyltransferase [Roseateles chitosanitabidus]
MTARSPSPTSASAADVESIDAAVPLIRVDDDPAALPRDAWNALLARAPLPSPFMRHEYLVAMHASGSAVAKKGWQAQFLSVWQGDELIAACPAYLKGHSYGEYVFDWAWAEAYDRHGLAYYPKLLVAVPFTPVPGSRLLARDDAARDWLVKGLRALATKAELSSVHVLFGDAQDQRALTGDGWLARQQVQFHWTGDGVPRRFTDYLQSLQREKRKKIQQEQRKVAEAGVRFEPLRGAAITPEDWDFFYECYTRTYLAHRNKPYLTREFFARMAADLPGQWLMFLARDEQGDRVAASLVAIDETQRAAYGRYWGSVRYIPNLHFDACYYQPLAWCLEHGWLRFEGGAQGEHKMARGLMPVATHSAHWLAHPQFREAVADFLEREGQAMDEYIDELERHQPFKSAPELERE